MTVGSALSNGAFAASDLDRGVLGAGASADLTCTTSIVRVPGCVVATPRAGKYLVVGVWDVGLAIDGTIFIGYLYANGAQVGNVAVARALMGGNTPVNQFRQTMMMTAITGSLAAGVNIELMGQKSGPGSATAFGSWSQLGIFGIGA